MSMSIVLDFFVKSTGTGEMSLSWLGRLPVLTDTCNGHLRSALRLRALCLSCLTIHYAELWSGLSKLMHPRAATAGSVSSTPFARTNGRRSIPAFRGYSGASPRSGSGT